MSLESQRRARLEDPGAELLDQVTRFGQQYGRIAIGAVAVALAIGAIAYFSVRARAAQEELAAGKLAEASILFWQGDYQRSLQSARQVAQQYGSTASGVDAHRVAGDDLYWLGDFRGAVGEYRAYLDRQGKGTLADNVRRSYAYALESAGDPRGAVAVYESLVGKFDRESSAEFLSAAARCDVAMGQKDSAMKRLQRVIDEFGETSYAATARVRLAELQASSR